MNTSAKQEWRRLPEFPLYEITEDGDVRHRETHTVLKEIENKIVGAWFYSLHRTGEKKRYSRHYQGLIYSAYPELLDGWKPMADEWPGYLINKDGQVMTKRWWRIVPPYKTHYVRTSHKGKRGYFDIRKFDYSVFEKGEES